MSLENPSLLWGLLALIILLVLLTGAPALLVRSWRAKIERDLKRTQRDIRRFKDGLTTASYEMRGYSVGDPEPYGSLASELQTRINKTQSNINNLEHFYVSVQEKYRLLKRGGLSSALPKFYSWYSLHADISELRGLVSKTQNCLEAVEDQKAAAQELGWRAALEIRQVNQYHAEVSRALEGLRAKNMGGAALDKALEELEICKKQIEILPLYLLAGDKKSVIQAADRDTIVQAHRTAHDVQTRLEAVYKQSKDWESGFSNLQQKKLDMLSALEALEAIIKEMPPALIISQEKAQFEGSRVISQNLNAAVSRPEIEDIENLEKEIDHITRTSREIHQQLQKARAEYDRLAATLGGIDTSWDSTAGAMNALATSTIYPLAWGKSAAAINGMQGRLNEIGPIDKARTAKQVTSDLVQCQKLEHSLASLSDYVDKLKLQHNELENILLAPEFQNVEDWLSTAHQLVASAQIYAPENWPRADATAQLPADLNSLEKELLRLAPDSVPQSISEFELEAILGDSQALSSAYQELRQRLSRVSSRMEEFETVQAEAESLLETGFTNLNQIKFLIRSNEYLTRIAARDCDSLLSELEKLEEELKTTNRGVVERKAEHAANLLTRIQTSALVWSSKLDAENKAAYENILVSVKNLDKIAALDENAIVNARQLLAAKDEIFAFKTSSAESGFQLQELPDRIKQGNDTWQTAAAALSALRDVERPVLDSHEEASANRQSVQKLIKDASRTVRPGQGWPPTSVSLEPSNQEFDEVEKSWKSLNKEPTRAIDLVARLGNLSVRYQRLAVDLERLIERAHSETERISGLEKELEGLFKSWTRHRKTFRDSELAASGIRQLVDEAKVEYARIKRDHKEINTDYDQVVQELASLVSRLRSARVRIDNENLLDVSGNLLSPT